MRFLKFTPLIILLLGIFSCKDNEKFANNIEKELSIENAKNIFNSHISPFTGTPDWENAYYYGIGKDILKVPLKSDVGIRELIFESNKDGSIENYVLLSFPNPDYIIEKINSQTAFNTSFSDYYGSSLKFQTNGDYIEGFYFENGKILNEFTLNKSTQAKIADYEVNCKNPKGPWQAYCATHGWLPGVTITAPGNTGGEGGSIPPVGPGPYVGGVGGYVYSGIFVMSTAHQSQYPRFTTMVKGLYDFVKNDTKVLNALKQWSGFNEATILEKMKFGKGPTIQIKHLDGNYGYFSKSENPNVINIDADWVRGLEQANLPSTQEATAFLLAVTALHEFVHQARSQNGLDRNYEYGVGFENSAFGLVINASNAANYSYRLYKK